MTERQVARLGFAYGCALPADYRAFLLKVGNGGAGPGSGLQRFGAPELAAEGDAHGRACEEMAADPERLARPFPLGRSVQFDFPDGEFDEGYDKAYEVWAARYFRPAVASGSLLLADYGGVTARLIVTGPGAGTVWAFDEGDGEWAAPFGESDVEHGGMRPEPRPYSFRDWYEHWLASLT
jgi:hypothetical protein